MRNKRKGPLIRLVIILKQPFHCYFIDKFKCEKEERGLEARGQTPFFRFIVFFQKNSEAKTIMKTIMKKEGILYFDTNL